MKMNTKNINRLSKIQNQKQKIKKSQIKNVEKIRLSKIQHQK